MTHQVSEVRAKYKVHVLGSFVFILLMMACKKAGTGGHATASVFVKHHGILIPDARVYIKYNAREFPGTDLEKYDATIVCGNTGHAEGHAHIKNLRPGNYYFYAEGYDSTIAQKVSGGVGIRILRSQRKAEVTLDIPVTE